MKWQGLKIPIIIASLLAGLALFFAGQLLYQKFSFNEPLNNALSNNKSIESFSIDNKGHIMRVNITLKYDADLMPAYKEIRKELSDIMGKKPFQLTLSDSHDDILQKVWYNSQYAVYEAAFRGNFQDMATTVKREASSFGVDTFIYVDQENIYLRLCHNNRTLDRIVPLNINTERNGLAPGTGGGNND